MLASSEDAPLPLLFNPVFPMLLVKADITFASIGFVDSRVGTACVKGQWNSLVVEALRLHLNLDV